MTESLDVFLSPQSPSSELKEYDCCLRALAVAGTVLRLACLFLGIYRSS